MRKDAHPTPKLREALRSFDRTSHERFQPEPTSRIGLHDLPITDLHLARSAHPAGCFLFPMESSVE